MPVLRSPDPAIEADTAIGINSAGEPIQEVDFMSFTPGNGYFVRYVDGRYAAHFSVLRFIEEARD